MRRFSCYISLSTQRESPGLTAMATKSISHVRDPDWPPPVRYAVALGATAVAIALRGVLTGLWGHDQPFITFFPAVVVSAWAGGFWPGMLTTVLCAAAADYFWLPPLYGFRVLGLGDAVALLLFVGIGALISGLSETMHRGRRRLESFLESLDDGFIVFDWGGRCRYVNDRSAGLLRQTASSIGGKTFWEVFPDILGIEIDPRVRPAVGARTGVQVQTFSRGAGRFFWTPSLPPPRGPSGFFRDTPRPKRARGVRLH